MNDKLLTALQTAEDHYRRGEFEAALTGYQALLAERLAAAPERALVETFTGTEVIIIDRLAELALLFGATAASEGLLAGLAQLGRQAGNRYLADFTTLKQIHLKLGQGQLRPAYTLLQTLAGSIGDVTTIQFTPAGLSAWEATCSWPGRSGADRAVLFSRLYLIMAWLLMGLGQYGQALAALEQGLTHTGPQAPNLAQQAALFLKLLRAQALLEKGELAPAGRHLAALESALDEQTQPGLLIQWLEISGKLNLLRGELGAALQLFNRILQLCQERGFSGAALKAGLNLAHILIYLNQTAAARPLLLAVKTRALYLRHEVLAARATYLLALAQARGQSLAGEISLAPSVFEMQVGRSPTPPPSPEPEPQLEAPQSDNHLAFFEDRLLSFYGYTGQRDFTAAARLLTEIQQVFETSDSLLIRLRLQVLWGMLAYYQGEIDRAEAVLGEVRPVLQALALKPELWQAQRFLSACWARLGRPPAEQQTLTQETTSLLTTMTDSLPAPEQALFLLNKWTADEEYLVSEINHLVRLKQKWQAAPFYWRPWRWWRLLERLNSLIHHLDRYKDALARQTLSGQTAQGERSPTLPLWRRLLAHPRDGATLSFVVLPDRLLLIQAGWLWLDFGVVPATRLQIREQVRRWHELVAQANGQPLHRGLYFGDDQPGEPVPLEQLKTQAQAESQNLAAKLAETLQLPAVLETLPQRVRRLTFLPDDSLHGFPFAAIRHGDKYLAEQYALSVSYEHNRRAPTAARLPESGELMAVGVSQGSDGISPLPGTLQELAHLETWLAQSGLKNGKRPLRKLLDGTADKQTVLAGLPQAIFLHIACHGLFGQNQPDQSGLVLIPRPRQVEILSLRELSQLDLRGLRHATLSSCWSADHFILPGRWVISLPETLWRAGAQSVLGSLWEVDDRLAGAFLARFYSYLDNFPRAEALRRTQLDCLQGTLPGYTGDASHPFYWAGYTLYGDNTSLNL